MSTELIIAIAGAGLALLGLITFMVRRPKKGLNREYFKAQWRELQKGLNKHETWPIAVIQADNLLDEALRRSRFKGKTMGERLVSAQRALSDNDSTWYAHKLRNRLVHEVDVPLQQKEVKKALVSLGQALKDLGAL